MTSWDDYIDGLRTLASLGDQLQHRVDDAEKAFRRSADDLNRGRDDATDTWRRVTDRARAAKATAQG